MFCFNYFSLSFKLCGKCPGNCVELIFYYDDSTDLNDVRGSIACNTRISSTELSVITLSSTESSVIIIFSTELSVITISSTELSVITISSSELSVLKLPVRTDRSGEMEETIVTTRPFSLPCRVARMVE